MMGPTPTPTEAELPVLPVDVLTEILLRVSTPSTLVHAAAASKSCRAAATADPEFLARYRERHTSPVFLGLYVPRAGPPSFHMPDSVRLGDDDARDLKDAARRAFDFGEIRRYQDHRLHDADAFILGRLKVHPDCRLLDCHNGHLLLTRGDEALEVHSPLARESILIPFPPDVVDPYCLQACLLHGHDKAAPASFRVVFLQHRRLGHGRRQARAVEYDSRRKSWQVHTWQTIKSDIEGTPEELMQAGHRIFCKYRGLTSAALVLDTNNMQFSVLTLPSYRNFVIGETEDNECCFVESEGCADHRLKVWLLDEDKLGWDLKKDMEMGQVLGEHVGYYRPRAIRNGIALVCSTTTHHHFVVDLKTCSMKAKLDFHGQSAYPMQMPWPPVFSDLTANGGFDRDGGPMSVGDARTGVELLDRIAAAIADAPYQIAAILQDLKINSKLSVGDANADTNSDARTGARDSDEIDDPSPGPTANAAGGFDRDGGPASVGDTRTGFGLSDWIAYTQKLERNTKAIADVGYQIAAILQDLKINANARTGARESDEIDDPSPGPSVGGCIGTNPLSEAKKAQLLHSSSIACFVPSSSTAPSALMPSTTAGSPSCPHQGKKRTGSRQSKGSPKAMGPVRRNWKRKPKHLKAIGQRRHHLFSIASKISEVQTATSSCREASGASTASVLGGSGSTLKITDVGKQPIIDVSITGAPSLSDPSAGESAEQRGEAAQDSNEPQDTDIQDPTATPTSATTEQSFGKDKNYVSNDYLIPDICDPFSDLMNPKGSHHSARNKSLIRLEQGARCHSKYCIKHLEVNSSNGFLAAGGFGWVAGPAPVGDTRTGSGESDTIEDLFSGTLAMAPAAAPAVEPEELLISRSRNPFCVQSPENDLLLQPPALASCPQQGRKRANSRESKGSPEAKGPGRCNWKRPKYLEAIFDLRRRQSSSIASKISDGVQIATSRCTEESAASTAAVGSTFTDVSITGAPSLFYPSGELAEQRGEAARGKGTPEATGRGRREKKLNPNYVGGDGLFDDDCPVKARVPYQRSPPPRSAPPKDTFPTYSRRRRHRFAATMVAEGAGKNPPGGGGGDNPQHQQAMLQAAPALAVQGEAAQEAGGQGAGLEPEVEKADRDGEGGGAGEKDDVEDPEEVMGLATLCLDFGKNPEPESGRCWRTDGKKWRCWRSTIPNEKYCERHMHLGRKRHVRVVDFGKNPEPESGRCRRTDGNKWRCSRSTVPNEKYCERHIHLGRKRPVQVDLRKNSEPKSGRCRRTNGRKRANSRESKGSPEAKGPGRRQYLEAIFDLRRQSSSIASKISDGVQIATSRCTEESAASTAAVGSTFTDVSITGAPSLFYPSGELAEQRGEAARGKGSPEATGRGRREKKLNPNYVGGDGLFVDDCPVKARVLYQRSPPPRSAPPKDTFPTYSRRRRHRFAATMVAEGEGKNRPGGGGGDNPQHQQAVLQAAPALAVQGEAAQEAGGQGAGLEPEVEKADRDGEGGDVGEKDDVEDPEEGMASQIETGGQGAGLEPQVEKADRDGEGGGVGEKDDVEDPEEVMGLATLCLDFGKNPEPKSGRCWRTDGKKWRCWRNTIPNEKYCERHMHLGRKRPVRVVDFGKNPEPESGRCRRTDGKKWRCSRSTVQNEKYCERHIHLGRKRPVQVDFGKNSEPKSGRCRRTDGNKWRCSRSTVPNEKYCERHIHLGRKHPVQVDFGKNSEPKSGRCRRTDGNKWHCTRSTIPNEKYYERVHDPHLPTSNLWS